MNHSICFMVSPSTACTVVVVLKGELPQQQQNFQPNLAIILPKMLTMITAAIGPIAIPAMAPPDKINASVPDSPDPPDSSDPPDPSDPSDTHSPP